jgi:hypothetical protein
VTINGVADDKGSDVHKASVLATLLQSHLKVFSSIAKHFTQVDECSGFGDLDLDLIDSLLS